MSVDRPRSRFQDPEGPVWLDGNLVEPAAACIQVTDPAVQFGLGVFETVAVREGRALERDAHLDRLFACAARLDVTWTQVPELVQVRARRVVVVAVTLSRRVAVAQA